MPQTASIKTRSLQTESLSGDTDRLINDVLLGSGVVDVAGLSYKVAQDTGANMQVKVGSGLAGDKAVIRRDGRVYIGEHQNATQLYLLAASDPTNPRIDLVVYRTYDTEADSSGNTYSDVEVVQGTPQAVPVAPAVPGGATALASILVGAGVSAIINADITDLRVEAPFADNLRLQAPLGVLGYAQITANQGTITTEVDLTGLTVTVNVEANRRIRLTGQASFTGGTGTAILRIKESTTQLQNGNIEQPAGNTESIHVQVVITPSQGSHTYKLTGAATGTATTVTASATSPAFILVEDIGPV